MLLGKAQPESFIRGPVRRLTLCLGLLCGYGTAADSFPDFNPTAAREYFLAVSQLALHQAGTNADTCLILAHVDSDLGRTDEAESWARQAIALDSQRAEAEVFLARLLIRQDRMEEAAACLRKAVLIDSSIGGGNRLLGMALDRLGDSKGAEEALSRELQRNPADAEAGFLLGRVLLDQGRTREAIARLEKACQSDPDSANGYYVLFQAQTSAGETAAAQKSLQHFQELKQREKSGMDAVEAKQSDEQKLRKCAAEFHNGMAVVLQREGQTTQAEVHLRQAILVAPDQPLAYQRLAALCMQAGRLREAEGFYATLERLQPNESGYQVNRGTLLLQLKDYPSARREFETVLRTHPDQPEALNNLARLYLSARQQLPDALLFSRRLVASQPTAAHYDLLGWALYLNGQTNEALTACDQAIRRDPGNSAYQERRRRLQQALGTTH